MTLYVIGARDELLAVRFACSPAWETLSAVRTFVHRSGAGYHGPWRDLVRTRIAQLDLGPLLATQPLRGFVPDFLTPPPRVAWPRLRDQLAEIRSTPAEQVGHELELCRQSLDAAERGPLEQLLADPAAARETLAGCMHRAWSELVAPFWLRIRALLAREIEERSRTLAHRGLRDVVDELHPEIAWTARGVRIKDRHGTTVRVRGRGLVLMPSAYVWPAVVAIVDEPWQPTIAYPARGIEELWNSPPPPPDALARVVGRTRALVLSSLERPLSTTTLAALIELSPAGVSKHLLALRDAGLVEASRRGHEVRYVRTRLGTALLQGR